MAMMSSNSLTFVAILLRAPKPRHLSGTQGFITAARTLKFIHQQDTLCHHDTMAPALRRANPKRDYAEYNDFKRLAADQLQTQLLDSDGYNAWLKDKTPVKRSVYVVAACILTLFCSSAIFVNSHNRGQVVATDQSNTILEALQHAQVSFRQSTPPTESSTTT